MNILDKLAKRYGADKFDKHNYTPFYYDLFKDRQKTVKKVVEIGTGEGASLKMWHDFFPNAKIKGADIDIRRVPLDIYPNFPRIGLVQCDQSSAGDVENLLKITGTDIDLFIDDGSHKPKDQVFTCLTLMPLLDKEVTYIIEDVADQSIFESFGEYRCEMRKFGKRYDDRIIVVKHC